MTQDQIERCDALWRELMDAERVRWMGGMVTRRGGIVADGDTRSIWVCSPVGPLRVSPADVLLSWDHPATIGCLVAMAREATGDAEASCVVYGGLWHCDWHGNESIAETEPEALLLAIQAATASQTPRPACNSFAR